MLVNTTKGLLDDSVLERRSGVDEDTQARIEWVEYWQQDEMVHRSAVAYLKEPLSVNVVMEHVG